MTNEEWRLRERLRAIHEQYDDLRRDDHAKRLEIGRWQHYAEQLETVLIAAAEDPAALDEIRAIVLDAEGVAA